MADCRNHEHSDSEDPEDELNSDPILQNKRLGESTLDAYYRKLYHLHLKPIKREDVAKWARLIEGDPNRVVSVLRLCKQGASNIWDDTERDYYPALTAIRSVAKEGGKRWSGLVNAGLADALCFAVIESTVSPYEPCPQNASDITKRQYATALPEPCWRPLEILSIVTQDFKRPPSKIDLLTIEAYKSSWFRIVHRLWQEQEKTKPRATHAGNWMGFSHLITHLLPADPTFLRIIDDKSDLTLALLFRYLFTTSVEGWNLVATAITDILAPNVEQNVAYRAKHPHSRHIFKKIMLPCANATDLEDPAPRFCARVAALLEKLDSCRAYRMLAIIEILYKIASEQLDANKVTHASMFIHAVDRSVLLWSELMRLFVREARRNKEAEKELEEGGAEKDPPCQNCRTVSFTLEVIERCVNLNIGRPPTHSSNEILQTLVKADLFGSLDVVLKLSEVGSGVHDYASPLLNTLFFSANQWPAMKKLLRGTLPRPISLRRLLDIAFLPSGLPRLHSPGAYVPAPNVISEMKFEDLGKEKFEMFHAQIMWQRLMELQNQVRVKNRCGRRGCRERAQRVCAKEGCRTRYCCTECQKLDWEEHRLVCGFAVADRPTPGRAIMKVVFPRKQWREDESSSDGEDTSDEDEDLD